MANIPGPAGRRPVVLVTRDSAYGRRSNITIAPVTSRIRGILSEVRLYPADGLARECVADLDSMTTVHVNHILHYVTTLSAAKMQEVDSAIRFALDL